MCRLARALSVTLILWLAAAPALAEDGPKWYDVPVQAPNKARPWINWSVGTLFIIACLGVALKNPHRTHLD